MAAGNHLMTYGGDDVDDDDVPNFGIGLAIGKDQQ